VGAAQGVGARFGEPEGGDLAGGDQVLDGAGDLLDGNIRIDAVLVEQVDAIGAESAQRRVHDLPDVIGLAVEASLALAGLRIDVHAEFGGDNDLIADRSECLANDLFVDERPVGLGGVEEGHAPVDRSADKCDASRWSVASP